MNRRIKIENKIAIVISALTEHWKNLTMESVLDIKSSLQNLARDQEVLNLIKSKAQKIPASLELYRDPKDGFVLLLYSEIHGTYRNPHDHGDAWVVYTVISGAVEMSNYFKSIKPNGQFQLVLKNQETLSAADTRIYFAGEIHDTLCVSENAVILRLTSTDLKEEERAGWMHRYQK